MSLHSHGNTASAWAAIPHRTLSPCPDLRRLRASTRLHGTTANLLLLFLVLGQEDMLPRQLWKTMYRHLQLNGLTTVCTPLVQWMQLAVLKVYSPSAGNTSKSATMLGEYDDMFPASHSQAFNEFNHSLLLDNFPHWQSATLASQM